MNKIFLMCSIISLTTILVAPLSPHAVNASTCVASSQTNDQNGPITVTHPVSSGGSCSSSVAGHAGQGSPSILSINAHNGPGAGSCSSAAVSHAGFDRSNGPSSADGSCSASSHSP
ncbi:MAG: hypothetical protein WCF23_21240 [Candidatus Nitrosopolaris sp.]